LVKIPPSVLLPETAQSFIVSDAPEFPRVMPLCPGPSVNPEMVLVPAFTKRVGTTAAVEATFRFLAPGPTMVRLLVKLSGAEVIAIVPVTLKLIVSPLLFESAIACRKDPARCRKECSQCGLSPPRFLPKAGKPPP
jgi:hypothetical protein